MEHRVLSCSAPLGAGGLGQHLAQLVDETRAASMDYTVFCTNATGDDPRLHLIRAREWDRFVHAPLLRFSPASLNGLEGDTFDRRVARHLDSASDRFMGFVGKSLHSFRRARENGTGILELVAANSHVMRVRRQHELAARDLGIADSWLGARQIAKTLQEYDSADAILVHSAYTRDSMLEAGIREEKLVRTVLKVDTRFAPNRTVDDDIFRVVYAGRLDATKGVPILIEAFRKLDIKKSELRLVGGFASRAIREYCGRLISGDERIVVEAGDPLKPFQRADVYVHPSYEDGFAYSPAEALACGTPAIVTADTGMKEHIRDGVNGFILPTGDTNALVDCLCAIRRSPLTSNESLLPIEARSVRNEETISSGGQRGGV